MGKSTISIISMVIFNSYLSLQEGIVDDFQYNRG